MKKGICWSCSYWDDFNQYCSFYNTIIYGQGFFKDCNCDEESNINK